MKGSSEMGESLPKFALAGYALFVLVTGGGRMWLQRRWTGDTGLRPIPPGATERVSVTLFAVGALAAPIAVLFELAHWVHSFPAFQRPAVQMLGVPLFLIGFVLTVVAQVQMGSSWRIGVHAAERTLLVTEGLFRWVRNPIFTGVMVAVASLFLAVPNGIAACAALSIVTSIQLQVRAVEEPHLLRMHGDAYRDYARSVGRFLPGIGRWRVIPGPSIGGA